MEAATGNTYYLIWMVLGLEQNVIVKTFNYQNKFLNMNTWHHAKVITACDFSGIFVIHWFIYWDFYMPGMYLSAINIPSKWEELLNSICTCVCVRAPTHSHGIHIISFWYLVTMGLEYQLQLLVFAWVTWFPYLLFSPDLIWCCHYVSEA